MSKPTIIIQARTNSRRFPKKVLAEIEKKPLIWHVINRAKYVKGVKQVVLATTRKNEDKILLKIAEQAGINGFAGDGENVLKRYYHCAIKYNADPIIRITGDCPLIDPKIIENLLKYYNNHNFDYVTNINPPTYPDGFDVEIFSFRTLEKTNFKAKLISEREHVTPYMRKKTSKFKIHNCKNSHDLSSYRLTVDDKSDLKLVKKIYAHMKPNKAFGLKKIIIFLTKNPKLLEINNKIIRNEGYLISLKNDRKITDLK